ncbi:MAG: hypothetical protein IPM34_05015 [Saprospiraceae bacterium]|nr:hypothetical protein [Saprospiraceae bacterium]
MSSRIDIKASGLNDQWLIWVLYPVLESDDPDLQYYYDFEQSYNEYQSVFARLGLEWIWQGVRLSEIQTVIKKIEQTQNKIPIVLNLCDGDEQIGVAGISVVRELEAGKIIYTGAGESFYRITTSKIPMKKCFDEKRVPTSPWMELNLNQLNIAEIFGQLKPPLIVKPAISAGSLGIGIKSVIHNQAELESYLQSGSRHYKNWDLYEGGVFVEEFIAGPEYTSFIVGSFKNPELCKVYPAVERAFESSLPVTEKILSFDRLWEFYNDESPLEQERVLWNYHQVTPELQEAIRKLSIDAYCAVGGEGYARIDFRQDSESGDIKVLEVNAQCGLSEDENYTSIGAILRLYNLKYENLILDIIEQAIQKSLSNFT